jgi:WD40 repeat protein
MVRLWDVGTGAARGTFPGPLGGGIRHPVAFSPDGRLLASGEGYGPVRLWDVGTGAVRGTFPVFSDRGIVTEAAFSPDGGLWSLGGETVRSGSGTLGQPRRSALLGAFHVMGLYAQ